MFKFIASIVGGVVLAVALEAHAAPAPITIKIDNFTYNPGTLVIPAGATVTWVNEDDVPHTAVASDFKAFRSKPMDTDDKFSFTFNTPGAFPYFCSIHPHMTAKIVVKAS
jgi:plastocyanin